MGQEHSWGTALKRIYVVTEGQSETNFVKRVLCPYFVGMGKVLIPTTVLTKQDESRGRMYKGGMRNYAKARTTITKDLAHTKEPDVFVTTMFDLYRLPGDTPGMEAAKKIADPYQKIAMLEQSMLSIENLRKPVYIPYVQLHEFETLLFANLDELSKTYFDYDIQPLRDALKKTQNPELINGGADTAPSKRVMQCIPDYDKATLGVSVLEKIGMDALCQKCKHFGEWISKLAAL